MINKRYSNEFKLQVVKEYLNGTMGCRTLAKKYNLPSKNYIHNWERQLIKKGLLKEDKLKNLKPREYAVKKGIKKTAYEKQLEKENFELKAKLAYYHELEKLVNIDTKKK